MILQIMEIFIVFKMRLGEMKALPRILKDAKSKNLLYIVLATECSCQNYCQGLYRGTNYATVNNLIIMLNDALIAHWNNLVYIS